MRNEHRFCMNKWTYKHSIDVHEIYSFRILRNCVDTFVDQSITHTYIEWMDPIPKREKIPHKKIEFFFFKFEENSNRNVNPIENIKTHEHIQTHNQMLCVFHFFPVILPLKLLIEVDGEQQSTWAKLNELDLTRYWTLKKGLNPLVFSRWLLCIFFAFMNFHKHHKHTHTCALTHKAFDRKELIHNLFA